MFNFWRHPLFRRKQLALFSVAKDFNSITVNGQMQKKIQEDLMWSGMCVENHKGVETSQLGLDTILFPSWVQNGILEVPRSQRGMFMHDDIYLSILALPLYRYFHGEVNQCRLYMPYILSVTAILMQCFTTKSCMTFSVTSKVSSL